MVDQGDIEFWSKKYGRSVTVAEVEEIKRNLRAFVDVLMGAYIDLKKRGLIDEEGNFIDKKPDRVFKNSSLKK